LLLAALTQIRRDAFLYSAALAALVEPSDYDLDQRIPGDQARSNDQIRNSVRHGSSFIAAGESNGGAVL